VTDGSLFGLYTVTIRVVKLSPPEVRFPPSGAKLSGTIVVKGSMQPPSGWTVKLVEISIDGKAWEEADGTDSWQYDLATSRLSKGKHTLTVRGTVKSGSTEVTSQGITTFQVTVPEKEGTSVLPIIAGIILVLVVLILLYFLVFRKKKATDRMEDLLGPPPVEGMAPPAMQPQFRPPVPPAVAPSSPGGPLASGAAAPTLQQSKEEKPAPQVRKVKVKCPACGKLFTEQDTGERPLHTVCKHCGAKGSIDSLPWDESRPGTEAPETPKEGPEPVPIVCPACGELFELKGPVSEAKCPACGAVGELDPDTQDRLKEAYDKVKELTLKCPKCSGMFHVKQGGHDIICPYCGTKGKLPR
jgi:DNA-directed RNA polymerase subunit RPC12/RpoP